MRDHTFCNHGNMIHNNHNAHAHSLTHAPAPMVHLLMRDHHYNHNAHAHSLAHASTPIILLFLVVGVHLPMRDHLFCDHGNMIHNNHNAHAHSLTHAPAPMVHLLMRDHHYNHNAHAHSLAHASTPIILQFLVVGVHLLM